MRTKILFVAFALAFASAVRAQNAVGRLTNLSTRGFIDYSTGNPKSMIVGFNAVIDSSNPPPAGTYPTVLLRAIGPSLSEFKVPNAEASIDPEFPNAQVGTFFRIWLNNQTLVRNVLPGLSEDASPPSENPYTWADMAPVENSVGAFLPVQGDFDSMNLFTCTGGSSYSFVIGGTGDEPAGVVLGEVYSMPGTKVTDVSTRGWVLPNDETMIVGFTVTGGPMTVLIRAVGPELAKSYGVADAVSNTTLTLYDSTGAVIGYDGAWQSPVSGKGGNVIALTNATASTFASVGAFGLTPGSDDSAMVVTLPPGSYTAEVGGNGQTGEALVEVYAVQ